MILLFAGMSGMASDSCAGWPAYLFFLTGLTLPLALIGVLVNGWFAFFSRAERRAWFGFLILTLWPFALYFSTKMARFC